MSIKEIGIALLVVVFFIGASAVVQQYADFFVDIPFALGLEGMIVYVAVTIIAVVIAPVSTLPLLPIAVGLWGSFAAAMLSALGWTIGAVVAFFIARHFGRPVLRRLVDLKKVEQFETFLPEEHIFWSLFFLRMALPVDVLSYAAGLFTKIRFGVYFSATVLGILPFAFIFSYAAVLPPYYQLVFGIAGIGALFIGYKKLKSRLFLSL
ncbi:MAG: VTT domain-containing protein [Candidatus Lloydbacteria bacterium]|nr:VTT domain-containing protein [Candidatus Lloydbacteria bacterium]